MPDELSRAIAIAQELVDAGRGDEALKVLSPALDALEGRWLATVFPPRRLGLRVLSTAETTSRRPPAVETRPVERMP